MKWSLLHMDNVYNFPAPLLMGDEAVPIAEFNTQTRQEDIRLILAAPDLLEACKLAVEAIDECLQWLKPDQGFGVVEAHENIKTAIAKAEGK